jgi:hypothetical protein
MKVTVLVRAAIAAVGLTAFMPAVPALAALDTYLSVDGIDGPTCDIKHPCLTLQNVLLVTDAHGVVHCIDNNTLGGGTISNSITIDCSNTVPTLRGAILIAGAGIDVHFRGLQLKNAAITFQQGAALSVENCKSSDNASGAAIFFGPSDPAKLFVSDSAFSENGSGIVIKPAPGGGVYATIVRVNITDNIGGGLKVDSSNGAVTVDLVDSVISYNGGNGVNALSGNGGFNNVINLSGDVIANNGAAGVQTSGATAAALFSTTLLDSNASGAFSAIGGGRAVTYGNNRFIGSLGTGPTGPAGLQ